jgi:glycerophosphoryl diester phosphodiesterase
MSGATWVGACTGDTSHGADPSLDASGAGAAEGQGYWRGVNHAFATSPRGNVVGVACHDCYGPDLASTIDALARAKRLGADIVELDLQLLGDVWSVGSHEDPNAAVPLVDVLDGAALALGDQVLSLELKQRPREESLSALLALLIDAGMGEPGRVIVLRCFDEIADNLRTVQGLIEREASAHASAFRLQVMYASAEVQSLAMAERRFDVALAEGWHGVEFNHRSEHVFELLDRARQLGLGTNVWTFNAEEGSTECGLFRNLTDTVTTDSSPQACRRAIESL